jgi:hypothetical protein
MSLWKWMTGQTDLESGSKRQVNRLKSRVSLPNFSSLRGRQSLDQVPSFPSRAHSKASTFGSLRNLTLRRRSKMPSRQPIEDFPSSTTSVELSNSLDPVLRTKIDLSHTFDPDTSFRPTEGSVDQNDVLSDEDEALWLGNTIPREFSLRRNIKAKLLQSSARSSSSESSKTSERSAAGSVTFPRRIARIGSVIPSLPELGYESDDDESFQETYEGFVAAKLTLLDEHTRDGLGGMRGPLEILAVTNGPTETSSNDESPRLEDIAIQSRNTGDDALTLDPNTWNPNSPRRRAPIRPATAFSRALTDLGNKIVQSRQSGHIPDSNSTPVGIGRYDHSNHPTSTSHVTFQDDFEERQAQRKRKYLNIFNESSQSSDEDSPAMKVSRMSPYPTTSDSINDPSIQLHTIIETAVLEDPYSTYLIPDVARKIYEAGYNTLAELKRPRNDDSELEQQEVDIALGEMSTLTRSAQLFQASKVQTWRHRATKLMEDVLAATPAKRWATERFFPFKRGQRSSLPSFNPFEAIKNLSVDQENQAIKARGNDATGQAHVREEAERGSPPAYFENSPTTVAMIEKIEEEVQPDRVDFVAAMLPQFYSNRVM